MALSLAAGADGVEDGVAVVKESFVGTEEGRRETQSYVEMCF